MSRFITALILLFTATLTALYAGDAPARRYSEDNCQFNMIYGGASTPIGLVTVGGSRMMVSTSGRDFNPILKRTHPNALTVHDMAHSTYSMGKEYVLLRDLLERRSVKAALIMIEPRGANSIFGKADPSYTQIAKFGDIPTAIATMWPESGVGAIHTVRDILWQHIAFLNRTDGKLHREEGPTDCDRTDNRLNIPVLAQGAENIQTVAEKTNLNWDISSPREAGSMRWIEAYRSLSQKYNVEFFFIVLSGMGEPLPTEGTEEAFASSTGMHLITLTPDLQRQLSPAGRRDISHINKAGREIFLPWLIKRIDEKCTRPDGCF